MRRESIYIYLTDRVSAGALEPILQRGVLVGEIRSGGMEAAISEAGSWGVVPAFLVLDMGDIENIEHALEDLSHAVPDGETSLILLGPKDNVKVFRDLTEMGVSDYLPYPVTADDLYQSVVRIAGKRATSSLDPQRSIAFVGVRGGVGTSTLAAAAVQAIATQHDRRVLLLDLDINGGCQHMLFQRDSTPSLLTMLTTPDRIDAVFMQRSLVEASKNLYVLSALAPDQQGIYTAEAINAVVRQAQQGMDIVVLDIPARPQVEMTTLLSTGTIFLCTIPTMAGLRDAVSMMRFLEQNHYPGKIVVVVNRVKEAGSLSISRESFEKRMGGAKVLEIAYDAKAPIQALMAQKSILEARGSLGTGLRRMVEELPTHTPVEPTLGGKIKRLLLG